jgi:hypothetical protein
MSESIIRRATVANVCAGISVLAAVGYACYSGNVELLKYVAAFALGYLFGARKVG